MTAKTFTDPSGDTLKVGNYGHGGGYVTVYQGENSGCFELTKASRIDIAKEILTGTKTTVIDGELPTTELTFRSNGSKRITCDGTAGQITEAEVEYFRANGLKYLAVAQRIETELARAKEEKERQERLAVIEKQKARRNELAAELSGTPWANYSSLPASTARAIDQILKLEEAAK